MPYIYTCIVPQKKSILFYFVALCVQQQGEEGYSVLQKLLYVFGREKKDTQS